MNKPAEQIQAELREFFPQEVVGWKPQATSGNRAMAVAYIDARDVENRLDETVGIDGWKDDYTVLPDGNVVCTLSVRLNGEWVGKTDVGGESDQKDEGDRKKAAFSDAFKRAAVKWGVGRYLYSLPKQWVDFDPQKKCFVRDPELPAAFRPRPKQKPPQAAPPKPAAPPALQAPAAPPQQAAPPKNGNGSHPPTEKPPAAPDSWGVKMVKGLRSKDKKLHEATDADEGGLLRYIESMGTMEGWEKPLESWGREREAKVKEWVGVYERQRTEEFEARNAANTT